MKFLSNLIPIALLVLFAACGGGEVEETTMVDSTAVEDERMMEPTTEAVAAQIENGVQVMHIEAGATGYQPNAVSLQANVPARLVFTRTVDSSCLEKVQVPAFGIATTDLPMNEPVAIEFTPTEGGDFKFACGMEMQSGTIVVKA